MIGLPISRILVLFTLIISAIVLSGCSNDLSGDNFSPYDLPELVMQQAVQFSESDELLLGSITQLLVDSEGNIILVDGQQRLVHAVDADGNYLQQVGANGSGPGEYQFPGVVVIDPDDALHLMNWATRAIITYRKNNGEWAFSSDFITDREKTGFFSTMLPLQSGDFYISSGSISAFPEDQSVIFRQMNRSSDIVRDSILILPGNERFTIRSSNSGGNVAMMQITQSEMHRQVLFAHDYNGTVYYGWSDSLAIFKLSPESDSFTLHADIDLQNAPFTSADSDSILSRFESILENNSSARSDLISSFPLTKPVFSTILSDESGYLWIQLQLPDNDSVWLILGPEGEPVYQTVLEDGHTLRAVRNGHAYTVSQSDLGVPTITAYGFNY